MKNEIIKLEVGPISTNCYIVVDFRKMAVVIDPGDDAEKILSVLDKKNAQVEFILLTHGHFDHIGALDAFENTPVYIQNQDLSMVNDDTLNLSANLGQSQRLNFNIIDLNPVKDGDTISFGIQKFKALSTPGHTPGSCVYEFDGNLFTGDTLFAGDVGRCDLDGGDIDDMRHSTKRLASLSEDYIIYPGHGATSRLSLEKATNPYLRSW